MSQCLPEGDWRAYLDGELAPEEMASAGAHLAECPACATLHEQVAGRAARVGAWIAELETAPAVAAPEIAIHSRWKWAAAGLAVAAALATVFVLAPKREQPVEPRQAATIAAAPAAVQPPAAPPKVQRTVARGVRRRPAQTRYFLAFDDEPIDTGTVMRVALGGGMEADVIVDGSGRPRAIRAIE